MSKWTTQEPQTVTKQDLKLPWLGGKNGKYFKCCFCGYKFQEGDYWRWIYTNNIKGAIGNPITCKRCDTGDIDSMVEKWKKMHSESRGKYWWFNRK